MNSFWTGGSPESPLNSKTSHMFTSPNTRFDGTGISFCEKSNGSLGCSCGGDCCSDGDDIVAAAVTALNCCV